MKAINLERLQARFVDLLLKYMADNRLNQVEIANLVGIQRTHVNALLHHNRPLSGYYLLKFISKGVIQVSEIYDGEDGNGREEDFWATASEAENHKLLSRIAKIRKKGIDIDSLLDAVDPPGKKNGKK